VLALSLTRFDPQGSLESSALDRVFRLDGSLDSGAELGVIMDVASHSSTDRFFRDARASFGRALSAGLATNLVTSDNHPS
jgi:hypothetical protein